MECQWLTGSSAGDGLALNRLASARNGGGLQVYSGMQTGNTQTAVNRLACRVV